MYKNLQILQNEIIEIDNSYIATEYVVQNGYIIPKNYSKFKCNHPMMEHIYSNFIELGKSLYQTYKGKILPYNVNGYSISDINCSGNLINYSNDVPTNIAEFETDNERVQIVYKWLSTEPEFKPVYLVPFSDNFQDMRVELYVLCDIAIYTYLINSALAHYYLLNSKKTNFHKDAKKLVDNEITIEKLMKCSSNEFNTINTFYRLIGMHFNIYDYHRKDRFLTSSLRVIIPDQTNDYKNDVSLNSSKSLSFKRSYYDIVSFYWDILKLQVYSISRGYCIANICYCGSIIEGRATLCDNCRRTNDALRKQEERDPEYKQKKAKKNQAAQ